MAIDFKKINRRLLADTERYLREWLPAGQKRGKEYVVGSLDGSAGESLSINMTSGVWKDFSTQKGGGDLISLFAAINNIKNGEAAKHFVTESDNLPEDTYLSGPEDKNYQSVTHSKYNKPEMVFEYRQADGKLVGYVYRFPPLPNERKMFMPRTAWRRHDGTIHWRWKKWTCATPIYQLPVVVAHPDDKVLIVEGEKKAHRAQRLMPPDWVVIGWAGGVEAIKNTDWQPLQGRYVWIWPDNDEPGNLAATALKRILPHLHVVNVPDSLPKGWDLGDAPDGFPVMDFIKEENEIVINVPNSAPHMPGAAALALTHLNGSNKPLATMRNLWDLLNYYKINVRYNVISKRVDINIPNEEFSVDNYEESAVWYIYSKMKEWEMPTDGHTGYLLSIADKNQYNPVLNWIRSKPWDRVPRLPEFYDTIESPEPEAKELLMRRWLITAVCMALYNGIDAAGCLVLQGPQNLGKTWWVKKLVPDELRDSFVRTDANVDPHNKDSVSQIISYWISELGEIGATFDRAELQAIKTFITRSEDIMRRPYGVGDKRYPRRTALVASVDQHFFLYDSAGDRRFWTIPCTAINSYHNIDMQQLWAEVLHLVEHQGETHRLSDDERAHVTRLNLGHKQIIPIHDMIEKHYETSYSGHEWHTVTQMAIDLGIKNISQRETRTIASYLRTIGINERRLGREGIQFSINKRFSHSVHE